MIRVKSLEEINERGILLKQGLKDGTIIKKGEENV